MWSASGLSTHPLMAHELSPQTPWLLLALHVCAQRTSTWCESYSRRTTSYKDGISVLNCVKTPENHQRRRSAHVAPVPSHVVPVRKSGERKKTWSHSMQIISEQFRAMTWSINSQVYPTFFPGPTFLFTFISFFNCCSYLLLPVNQFLTLFFYHRLQNINKLSLIRHFSLSYTFLLFLFPFLQID